MEAGVDRGEGAPAFPAFLLDALVDENVRINGDTDAKDDTRDTRQSKRRPEQRQRREGQDDIDEESDVGDQAPAAIEQQKEADHQTEADEAGEDPHLDGIGTEVGADGTLFDDGKFCRQCACAKQRGKRVGLLDGEAAGNLSRATGDRLADDRSAQHLVVQDDCEGTSDVSLGDLGEAACTGGVEAEVYDGLVGLLVEGSACIGQTIAGQFHPVENRELLTLVVGQHGDPRLALIAQQMEAHLRSGAEQLPQPRGILLPRQLNQNPVVTYPLNGWLCHAHLVDALANDLEALLDSGTAVRCNASFSVGQRDGVVGRSLDAQVRLPHRRAEAYGIGEGFQLVDGGSALRGVAQRHRDGVSTATHPSRVDPVVAKHPAAVLQQVLESFVDEVCAIHFQHKVRAAAKVESKRDPVMRQPRRQAIESALGKHVRQGNQYADEDDEGVSRHHPGRISHVIVPARPSRRITRPGR